MTNIYYNPEAFGLEQFGMIEEPPNYSFNLFVVWKDKNNGDLFYDQDSGCSCPSPFENITSITALNKVDKNHFDVFEQAVKSFNQNDYLEGHKPSPEERQALISKVKKHLFT